MRLGTTAFSFTNEWLARRYTLPQLLRRIAALELGPAIELIGFQTWRDYPNLEEDEIRAFRWLVEELGLEPAALGAYADLARRPDRTMTTDEAVDYLAPQIAIAKRLGFPLVRLHPGIPVAVLERLATLAERAEVTLATEFQGAQGPEHPAVAAVVDCRERLGTPYVALALDFSVAMSDVPTAFVGAVTRLGMRRADLERIVELWAQGASTPELHAALAAVDAPRAALDEVRAAFVRFGAQEPRTWRSLVPHIAYAHAKFWELDESGNDPTVRTTEMVDVLRTGGFDGFLVSEWGGNAWADVDDVDAFEVARRHLALCRALVEARGGSGPAVNDSSNPRRYVPVDAKTSSPRRRWMRLAAVVMAAASVLLVAGVSATSAKTHATVTLKVLAQSNGQGNPQLQQVLDLFQKKNPDVKIDATYLPIGDSYANTLRTQLQGGNGPDVFYVTPGGGGLQSVLPLAKAGYVADLSKRAWANKIPLATSARPLYWQNGKLYAVPIDVVPVGVLYHPDLLSSLGLKVPTTMKQFLSACKTAKSKGKSFLNVAGASSQNAGLLAVELAGSYVLAKDPQWNSKRKAGKVTFAGTPGWRAALQRIVDMKNAGCFPAGAEANDNIPATPGFVSGQVVSWVLPSSITNLIKSFNPQAQYNFFAMPGETAASTQVFASPTDAFAVNSRTKNKAAAMRLVDFWATAAASGAYAKATGASSVYQAGTGKHLAFELRGIAPVLKQKDKVHTLMQVEWSNPAVFDTLGKDVQGLLTGQKTVAATLADLDAAWGGK